MKKILSLILMLISLHLVTAKNELPQHDGTLNLGEQPVTKSKLYPNPAVDFIIIKNSSASKIKNVSVLSMVGSVVINKEISDNNNNPEVSVSKLPTGRYFVKVSYSDGNPEILTLIKL
ncbi:MAG: T9SS type A sorting domain-containing protein [Flavobacteriaceae bacterium]|jgi:hypothetical protein|nr:T9SS type A sorting domain-containing protein [Flavobacteriaceae bacterium]